MWRSTATPVALRLRAKLLAQIREFFAKRKVLEVETPLLGHSTIPDPNIHSFYTQFQGETLYLQTSPEFAMKRLLASGSGDIFQICKAFRDGEVGGKHNPEFTILEWYRIGFDHHQLMAEMEELFNSVLGTKSFERFTYQELFQQYLQIDPLTATTSELQKLALTRGLDNIPDLERDGWLNILMSTYIEPYLGKKQPCFVYDYPLSQAALAKESLEDSRVAERFEVYIEGVELANGFHELTNAVEQRTRFVNDLEKRQQQGLPQPPLDENFLAALEQGMPECAGVALGLDRLLMLLVQTNAITKVLSFPVATS